MQIVYKIVVKFPIHYIDCIKDYQLNYKSTLFPLK